MEMAITSRTAAVTPERSTMSGRALQLLDLRGLRADHRTYFQQTEPQEFPDQGQAGQGQEAEPSHPSVDSPEDRQHHPVRCTSHAHCPIRRCDDWHLADEALAQSDDGDRGRFANIPYSYNAKRRHWRKTRLGI
jgi:hypothetical protein